MTLGTAGASGLQSLGLQLAQKPYGSFRKLGVPYVGVLIIRILLFRVLYSSPLFSETPV